MRWTTLHPIHAHPWHSKGLAKQRDALNAKIASALKNRQQLDAMRDRFASADPTTLNPNDLYQADMPALNRFRMFQEELKLREEMAAFFQAERVDQQNEHDAILERLEAARAKLRQQLVEIGYIGEEHEGPGRIAPLFFQTHPTVHALNVEAASFMQITGSAIQQNEQSAAALIEELAAMRDRVVNVL